MKRKKFLVLGIIFLVWVSLSFFSYVSNKPSEKQKLADQVRTEALKKIISTTNLRPFGRSGQMLYQIEMLGLSLQCIDPLDIIAARKLIVYAEQTFLDIVNNNEKIRTYLSNYPFTAKNIEIRIFCYKPDGSNVTIGDITYFSIINGIVEYYLRESKEDKMERPFFVETYEEALKKLNAPGCVEKVGLEI